MASPRLVSTPWTPVIAWGLAAGAGFFLLAGYHAKAGRPGSPPGRWPAGSAIPLDRARPTLLAFIHPACPCSGASAFELGRVESAARGGFAAHVVTFRPDPEPENWEEEGGRSAAEIPGATRWVDRGGREASRFGVETSGHVLLYDPDGRLLFSGGVTASRGHRGENRGEYVLIGLLGGGRGAETARNPVYGCPILEPGRARERRP